MFKKYRTALAVFAIVCVLPLVAVAISSPTTNAVCACCGEGCRCATCGCDEAGCSCDRGGICVCTEECHLFGCGHCNDH
jgi:hypothetical protein